MDELLWELAPLEDSAQKFATSYADSLAIVIQRDTRTSLISKGEAVIKIIEKKCADSSLQIAAGKTVVTPNAKNKSKDTSRITLKVNNKRVKIASEAKYLGVIIDDKLNFYSHYQKIDNKIGALRR